MTKNQSPDASATHFPKMVYGTAWKEDHTRLHTLNALQAGFRAIDTANQRKHYFEEGVGQGISEFLGTSGLKREDLFLQTKFTFARGQDHRKPYRETDPIAQQVRDSFASSLQHLNTNYLDSYVLHGPYDHPGLSPEDFEAWSAMEEQIVSKKARALGVSNVTADQLEGLCEKVKVKPSFVQNRCYARLGWDLHVRTICKREGIHYQGFSLLTTNRGETEATMIQNLAKKYLKNNAQIIFRFCHQVGMICLTGTTSPEHMRQDLDIFDFELSAGEVSQIENMSI
jgi:diketogulonate reductase-like aldo/keto reductase